MKGAQLFLEMETYSIEKIESLAYAAKIVFLSHIELLDLPEELELRRENVRVLAFSLDDEDIKEELKAIWEFINLAESEGRWKDSFRGRLLLSPLGDYETDVQFFHDQIDWFASYHSKIHGVKSEMESYEDFNRNQERERDQLRGGSNRERRKLKPRWWRWSRWSNPSSGGE